MLVTIDSEDGVYNVGAEVVVVDVSVEDVVVDVSAKDGVDDVGAEVWVVNVCVEDVAVDVGAEDGIKDIGAEVVVVDVGAKDVVDDNEKLTYSSTKCLFKNLTVELFLRFKTRSVMYPFALINNAPFGFKCKIFPYYK